MQIEKLMWASWPKDINQLSAQEKPFEFFFQLLEQGYTEQMALWMADIKKESLEKYLNETQQRGKERRKRYFKSKYHVHWMILDNILWMIALGWEDGLKASKLYLDISKSIWENVEWNINISPSFNFIMSGELSDIV